VAEPADPQAEQAASNAVRDLNQAAGLLAAAVGRAQTVARRTRAELGAGHRLGDQMIGAILQAAAACGEAQAETSAAIAHVGQIGAGGAGQG
jgi:hypothetical protein